ncbi:elongator complex protein 1 [Aristolochia californica]|uniref:elongator complex protein 1 n=1 Tax=Aristolochia californica TaxID=171875 RepID=UPI0035D55E3B
MKNLKLYSEFALNLELLSEEESPLLFAIDIERNRMFFASSAGVLYFIHPNISQKGTQWCKNSSSLRDALIDLEPGDSIQALEYLMEKEALIIGTANGLLLLYNVDDSTTEAVGKVEGGVYSIAPSPDGALLVVTAGFGQILVMTQDWEVLYENTLDSCELDTTDSSDLNGSLNNLLQTHISWRGDGKYFASLSSWYNSSSLKKLKIWERETGTLHASSELKSFMGAALDWIPSGAKVVASYDRNAENKCPLIVLFERNGLERSSFSIDEPVKVSVEFLKWNCSSDLLAALVSFEEYDAIKIWSFSNNHWYLKQEIKYPNKDRVKFTWEPTKPLQMICWTLSGRIITYNFVWVTAVTDDSTALVIDNGKILVSPLAISLIPPPMSLFNLKCPSAVQDFAFFLKNSNLGLALGLSDGSLSVVELPVLDNWEQLEGKDVCIDHCQSDISIGTLRHLTWLDLHTLLCVSQASQGFSLLEIELVCSENSEPGIITSSGWHAKIANSEFIENGVIGIVPNPTKKGVAFVQFDGGSVFEYTSKLSNTSEPAEPYLLKLDFEFSSSCPWMNAVPVLENETRKALVFGLDDSGRLQVNGKILCHNCSSFSFYSTTVGITKQAVTHLIVTTKQDYLFIIGVEDILSGSAEIKFDNYVSGNTKKRQEETGNSMTIWERGARLVGVIHGNEACVVLQTNRGNLECIYPRKLVLDSIVNALIQQHFKDAIVMVRRHRIDFNVIVDHCGWQSFLQWVPEFVRQVNDLSHITHFICSMKNENVMQTLYKNICSPCSESPKTDGSNDIAHSKSKVSSVLQAIKTALEVEVTASPARELCILTSLARSDPPALEEALKRIKVIREKELLGTDDTWRNSYPSAEDSVKHLLWLSEPEAVYEAALGLYDLNLAAIVALNSQKDPKEFLPFLQGLDHMQPLIMKYTIDLRLHRYESALKHIFLAGEAYYRDCISLIKNNPQLFPLGVQLFSDGHKRCEVLESWGDYLYEQKSFEDAATNYLCCSSLPKAMKAYRASGNWRSVFSVAGLNLEGKEVLQLANEICEELNALGKPAEAARVALEYCGDVAGAVGYFVTAREWEEALRVGLLHGKKDLISEVKAASLECMSTLVSEFEEGKEKVGKYLARYLAVRQRRLLLKAKLELEERSLNDIDDDNASETSSNFSGMSAYTTGTIKGSGASVSSSTLSKTRDRRRQRKKGGKIRAGSPGEEMALVDHLKGMAFTSGVKRELQSLIHVLVMLGKEESSRKLQLAGHSFQVSQLAAVKLAEDTMSNEMIDENTHNLTNYIKKVNSELPKHEAFSWQSKVLLPP